MKYVLLLLFFVSVVYGHPHTSSPPGTHFPGLYFDGREVSDYFDIREVGTANSEAIECRTDLDTCCSTAQSFHRGNWFYPNGERLEFQSSGYSMYQSRHDKAVKLHRRREDVLEGEYCCNIETIQEHRESQFDRYVGETVCIKLTNFSRSCPSLEAPEKGDVTFYGDGHGSNATFFCDKGYNLLGNINMTCLGGEWVGDRPICEDSCLPEGRVWDDCGPHCPETCDNYGQEISCQRGFRCLPGCFCPNGTVDHDGVCIPPHKCPNWCPVPEDVCNGSVHITGRSTGDAINYTCHDGFEPVGYTEGVCLANRTWSIEPRCKGCAIKLYVMAFTGTKSGGGSDRHHDLFISIKTKNGMVNKTISFYNRQGNDMNINKGDLWTFVLSDYDDLPCFNHKDALKLAIVQSNSDNWHIESVTSILRVNSCCGVQYIPLTIDMEANHWIGTSYGVRYERFNLTRYLPQRSRGP